ncbi:MAG: tail fiber protein [Algicola sp.]|nr:tail fiber protein [Algicola sp.]
MEFIMGGIIMFGGNFAPRSWASCEGQLLAISQNQALYAILGTTWGGDGRTTFAIPDLRGRVPAGIGRGPGLSQINLGRHVGTETTQMTITQMPAHTHTAAFAGTGGGSGSLTATAKMFAAGAAGDVSAPANNYLGDGKAGFNAANIYNATKGSDTLAADAIEVALSGSTGGITGGTVTVGATGGSQKLNNIQPSLGMRYLICTQGTFPSRS